MVSLIAERLRSVRMITGHLNTLFPHCQLLTFHLAPCCLVLEKCEVDDEVASRRHIVRVPHSHELPLPSLSNAEPEHMNIFSCSPHY